MGKLQKYLDYAIERAIKTVAQSALATIGIGATGLFAVDWANVGSVALLAGVMSLLNSVLDYDRSKGEVAPAPAKKATAKKK